MHFKPVHSFTLKSIFAISCFKNCVENDISFVGATKQ
jgi:hypothetical protein